MAKRFTSTELWKEDWYIEMPTEYQLFWNYMLAACSHAGFFKVNLKSFCGTFNVKVNPIDALEWINSGKERIRVLDKSTWYIEDFYFFQYGKIFNLKNKLQQSIEKEFTLYNIPINSIRGLIEIKGLDGNVVWKAPSTGLEDLPKAPSTGLEDLPKAPSTGLEDLPKAPSTGLEDLPKAPSTGLEDLRPDPKDKVIVYNPSSLVNTEEIIKNRSLIKMQDEKIEFEEKETEVGEKNPETDFGFPAGDFPVPKLDLTLDMPEPKGVPKRKLSTVTNPKYVTPLGFMSLYENAEFFLNGGPSETARNQMMHLNNFRQPGILERWVSAFNRHLTEKLEIEKTAKDYAQHLSRWLRIMNKNNTNPDTLHIPKKSNETNGTSKNSGRANGSESIPADRDYSAKL